MTFDRDAYEERAAIMEFDGGLSRFEAETLAAQAQGLTRWQVTEAINAEDNERNLGGCRDQRETHNRDAAHDLPRVQPSQAKENGPMLGGDVQAGRGGLALPPLRAQRRGAI